MSNNCTYIGNDLILESVRLPFRKGFVNVSTPCIQVQLSTDLFTFMENFLLSYWSDWHKYFSHCPLVRWGSDSAGRGSRKGACSHRTCTRVKLARDSGGVTVSHIPTRQVTTRGYHGDGTSQARGCWGGHKQVITSPSRLQQHPVLSLHWNAFY